MGSGLPLIHNGQEADNDRRLAFFERDPIIWREGRHDALLRKLIALKIACRALHDGRFGAAMVEVPTSAPADVFGFTRGEVGGRVLAVFNLSPRPHAVTFTHARHHGRYRDALSGKAVSFTGRRAARFARLGLPDFRRDRMRRRAKRRGEGRMTKHRRGWIAPAAIAWAAMGTAVPAHAESLTLASPDGKIAVTVSDEGGQATYAIRYAGEEVIAPSRLGMLFAEHHGFERDLAIVGATRASRDMIWEQPWGERRLVRDQHNELAVSFAVPTGPQRQMVVRLRAFDSGVGSRHEFGEQPALAGDVRIVEELTHLAVGQTTRMWYTPSDEFNRYEYLTRTGLAGSVDDAHTPATFRKESGLHFAIHEAALVDYSAMSLGTLIPGL